MVSFKENEESYAGSSDPSPNMTSNKRISIVHELNVRESDQDEAPATRITRFDDTVCQNPQSTEEPEVLFSFDDEENVNHFEDPNMYTNFEGWVKSDERKASIYVVSNRINRRKSIFQRKTCGFLLSYVHLIRNYVQGLSDKNRKRAMYVTLFVLYNAFLCYAISLHWGRTNNSQGIRLLVTVTLIVYVIVLYYSACRKRILRPTLRKIKRAHKRASESNWYRILGRTCWVVLYTGLVVFLVIDTAGNRIRLMSAAGVVIILMFGYVFSADRTKVKWRPVLWGVALQYAFGFIFIRSTFGRSILEIIEYQITIFLGNTNYGTEALFAYLVSGKITDGGTKQHIFAFQTLTAIIFVSIWMSVLYHYGVMQIVVVKIGWFLEMIMGTSVCESMAVASNIALSLPMACLTIKPYLEDMTLSELHVVMAAGFANVPGSVQGAYIQLGVDAVDMISASILSTCGSFAFSKLFYPETGKSKTRVWNIGVYKGECKSMLEAIVVGAIDGAMLLARICATLVAFGSFISFVNRIPTWLGSLVGIENISLKWMFSKLFLPVAYIMGVEPQDCSAVAWLVGVNLIFSNTSAFRILIDFENKGIVSHRSAVIATYSVCGYYTISSLGLALGTLGSLIPERRSELSSVVVRSLISGASICFMTACVAGSLTIKAKGGIKQKLELDSEQMMNKYF